MQQRLVTRTMIIGALLLGALIMVGFCPGSRRGINVEVEYRGETHLPDGTIWADFRLKNREGRKLFFQIGRPEAAAMTSMEAKPPLFGRSECIVDSDSSIFFRVRSPSQPGSWRLPVKVRREIPALEKVLGPRVQGFRAELVYSSEVIK